MVHLKKAQYPAAFRLYQQHGFFFPLVATVLLDEQDGLVYADSPTRPSQVYVEHAFGFSQVFGASVPEFENDIEAYLFDNCAFESEKVRLYTPNMPDCLSLARSTATRSDRVRFDLDESAFRRQMNERGSGSETAIETRGMFESDVQEVQEVFGVVERFWRSPSDFLAKGDPQLVFHHGRLATICYAAAVAEGCREIDVLTLADYRRRGLGALAVRAFVESSLRAGCTPLWDCYANNESSMTVAGATGFVPRAEPYPFFTITRP